MSKMDQGDGAPFNDDRQPPTELHHDPQAADAWIFRFMPQSGDQRMTLLQGFKLHNR